MTNSVADMSPSREKSSQRRAVQPPSFAMEAPEVRDAQTQSTDELAALPKKVVAEGVNFFYEAHQALFDISLEVPERCVTALIGPSGCGKSTFLRCLNRMNDMIDGTRFSGRILLDGEDIYSPRTDVVALRKRVGMVFQKSNPFPKSIYDNIAYGPRVAGIKHRSLLDEIVQRCLEQAALWDEVKDRLGESALQLSGGQQQRLCIARALATDPDLLLMDEPASALDPKSTARIEDLIFEIERSVHDCHRHPQHAAGCPSFGSDGLFLRRAFN